MVKKSKDLPRQNNIIYMETRGKIILEVDQI